MKKIILVGAGGHCKVIIDIIRSKNEYKLVGITDKDPLKNVLLDVPIIGDDTKLEKLWKDGVEYAFVSLGGLGDLKLRNKIYTKLKRIGFKIPVLIHNTAIVSKYTTIDEGTCVMAGSIINAGAVIGKNCILNSGSIIEHDCNIGENTHISPNSSIAGGVNIGFNTHIGIGSSIIEGKVIGNNVTIGAGAVVIDNIKDNSLAVGVPAKVIRLKK